MLKPRPRGPSDTDFYLRSTRVNLTLRILFLMCPLRRCVEKLPVTFNSIMTLHQKKQQEGVIKKNNSIRSYGVYFCFQVLFCMSCAQKMPTVSLGRWTMVPSISMALFSVSGGHHAVHQVPDSVLSWAAQCYRPVNFKAQSPSQWERCRFKNCRIWPFSKFLQVK